MISLRSKKLRNLKRGINHPAVDIPMIGCLEFHYKIKGEHLLRVGNPKRRLRRDKADQKREINRDDL